jgi:hypothetical protein
MDTRFPIGNPTLADLITAQLTDSWRGGVRQPIDGCEVNDLLRQFAQTHPAQCAHFVAEAISEAEDDHLCRMACESTELMGTTAALAIRAYTRACMEHQQAYLLSTERLAS